MIHLSPEIEARARQLATALGLSIEDAVALAIEQATRTAGLATSRRRQSVSDMLRVGSEIASLPVLDPRTPQQMMDDIGRTPR